MRLTCVCCLCPQEKSDVEPELPPALSSARKDLQALIEGAARTQAEHGLQVRERRLGCIATPHPHIYRSAALLLFVQIDPQEYVRDVMHCGLMQVVYEWARGTPFDEICTLTDVMEGSIVRAIVRLDQACR